MEILTALVILRLFTGVVSVGPDTGWKPGLAVVRTQADYDRFVAHIPKHKLEKRQPAPPSTDPLLKRPAIDFDKRMLIVVASDFVLTKVKIEKVERGSDTVIVHARFTTPPDARKQAHPLFYGQYAAAEVERVEGEVLLRRE